MNNKGSILVVTLSFIFVFNLLGVASIYHATNQNEETEKRLQSLQAFWLADAGVERAKKRLKDSTNTLIQSSSDRLRFLGKGSFDVYSQSDPDCTHCIDRWRIDSAGTRNSQGVFTNQVRRIRAVVAKYDIDNVSTTRGPIKDFDTCPMASVAIDCTIVEENVDFCLESILSGTTQQDIFDSALHTYNDPANAGDVDPIEGVTVITMTGNNVSIGLNTDNMIGSAFVYIDMSGVTSNAKPTVNIAGSSAFSGIIWIFGEAEIKGTTEIRGAVFVESEATDETKVIGNATLNYDAAAIQAALGSIGNPNLGEPSIIAWKEM